MLHNEKLNLFSSISNTDIHKSTCIFLNSKIKEYTLQNILQRNEIQKQIINC